MIEHVLLPSVPIKTMNICDEHRSWIKDWLQKNTEECERGIVSSSNCVAGFISEILLYDKPKTDWVGIMQDLLEVEGVPLAYSQEFGKLLYKFNHWSQSPVHAIYSRWWIERNLNQNGKRYSMLIEDLVQSDGWIYNPKSSETQLRTRMKSEIFMSLAMGSEILTKESSLRIPKERLVATAISLHITSYVSAEYFRFKALQTLGKPEQMVTGVKELLEKCKTKIGYADFSIKDKIDDYMGVAKRSSRDVAIFSPVTTLQALYLTQALDLGKEDIQKVYEEVAEHFRKNPLDIPPFRMRDLTPEFGQGKTIYEVIAAAALMNS